MPTVVTFDPIELLIHEIDTGLDNELLAIDIYNNWKNWLLDNPQNMGHPQAFRYVGGDERSPTSNLGSTFFLMGGWKLKPAEHSHKLTVIGNLFVDGGVGSIFVPTNGAFTVHTETVVTDLISGLDALFASVQAVAQQQVADALRIAQTWKALALDSSDPFTKTPTQFRSASGDIIIDLSGDPLVGVTGSRQ